MSNLYNSRGRTIGYRLGDEVYNNRGRKVGIIRGDRVTGRDGRYIGTICSGNRLYYFSSHSTTRGPVFSPTIRGVASRNIVGIDMIPAGGKDVNLDELN